MNIHFLHRQFCDDKLILGTYRKKTISSYKSTFNLFLKDTSHLCHIENITDITPDLIYSFFYNGRKKRRWIDSTFVHYRKGLVSFFDWCVEKGYITSSPIESLDYPKQKNKNRTKIQPLSQKDASSILEMAFHYPFYHVRDGDFLRYRNRAIIATFIHAGLRRNELLNLKVRDVKPEKGIQINDGKGGKDRYIPIIVPELSTMLESYLDLHLTRNPGDQFFTSSQKNKRFSRSGLNRLFRKLKEETGVAFSCQKLRTTFACFMAESGVSPYNLQEMMGHSKLETTMNYYVKVRLNNIPKVDRRLYQVDNSIQKIEDQDRKALSQIKDLLQQRGILY